MGVELHSAKDPPPEPDANSLMSGGKPAQSRAAKRLDRDMGSALRSIYQRTIDEDIPDEMLSLLGKLE